VRNETQVLLHLTLPLAIACEAVAFGQARGIHVNVYLDDVLYVAEMTPEARFYHSLSPMAPVEVVGDLLAFLQREPSKGQALLLLASHVGISRERTLAIGDNRNDESMLRAAAVGVAMGNASPEVQAVADWVAPPVEAQGVAAALERFVLTDEGAGA